MIDKHYKNKNTGFKESDWAEHIKYICFASGILLIHTSLQWNFIVFLK